MELSVVIAIIRRDMLEKLEQGLREMGVRGITVSKVKGYPIEKFFNIRHQCEATPDQV